MPAKSGSLFVSRTHTLSFIGVYICIYIHIYRTAPVDNRVLNTYTAEL